MSAGDGADPDRPASCAPRSTAPARAGSASAWWAPAARCTKAISSLIRTPAAENDVTALFWGGGGSFDWIVSQIDYKRDAGRDFALAEAAGLDIVFAPYDDEFFPASR